MKLDNFARLRNHRVTNTDESSTSKIYSDILEAQKSLKRCPNLARTKEEWQLPPLPFLYRIPLLKQIPILYKHNDVYRAICAQNKAKDLTAWDKEIRLTLKEKIQGDIYANKTFRITLSWIAGLFTATTLFSAALIQLSSLSITSGIAEDLPKEKIEKMIDSTGRLTVFSFVIGLMAASTSSIGVLNSYNVIINERSLRILEDSITLSNEDS